jgi:hypothetical protein
MSLATRITSTGDIRVTSTGQIRGTAWPLLNFDGKINLAINPQTVTTQALALTGKVQFVTTLQAVTIQALTPDLNAILGIMPDLTLSQRLNLTGNVLLEAITQMVITKTLALTGKAQFIMASQIITTQTLTLTGKSDLGITPQVVITQTLANISEVNLNVAPRTVTKTLRMQTFAQLRANLQIIISKTISFTGAAHFSAGPHVVIKKTLESTAKANFVTNPQPVLTNQMLCSGQIRLMFSPTVAVPNLIIFKVNAQLIIDRCQLFHARCAQLVSACQVKNYFNLASEVPENFLNRYIVQACLQLYQDTGLPERTYPLDRLEEWHQAQCYLTLAYALPHLHTFTMQGAARAERLAAQLDVRFMDPREVIEQINLLKSRYQALVVLLKPLPSPSKSPFDWIAI